MVGNTRLHRVLSASCRLMERMADMSRFCFGSGPMAGMALTASPSSFSTRIDPHTCSGWSCCAVFASLSLSPDVSVVVAVSSILLAIIELRARERGFWEDGDSRSRARLHACVRKEAPGLQPRVVERFRFGRASCQGRTPIGDHRRWPPLVRWRAACC